MTANSVTLSGEIIHIEPLRHTPAGLPLLNLKLAHCSQQVEAGMPRQTDFEVTAVAIGEVATETAKFTTGAQLTVQGFLAARRRMGTQLGTQLILHITQIVNHT